MFKNWKQRRLRELKDELRGMVAARVVIGSIVFTLDDDDDRKQEGQDIIEDLLVDEKELRLKIARIEARL